MAITKVADRQQATLPVSTTENALAVSAGVLSLRKSVLTLSDGATITWDVSTGYNAKVTIAGNRTLSITNPVAGEYYTIIITQDGTGGRTLTLPSSINAQLNLGASAVTILVCYYDGTTYNWSSNAATSATLAADFTTSSTTRVSTNLTFPIAANEIYYVNVEGTCKKATSATGLKFAIDCPTGCVIKGKQLGGGATLAAALVPSLITAINTLGTTLATGTNIEVAFSLSFRVINGSTAGSITLQMATVTSNVATLFAGTRITWSKANNV